MQRGWGLGLGFKGNSLQLDVCPVICARTAVLLCPKSWESAVLLPRPPPFPLPFHPPSSCCCSSLLQPLTSAALPCPPTPAAVLLYQILEEDPQAADEYGEEEVAEARERIEAQGLKWELPKPEEDELELLSAAIRAQEEEEGVEQPEYKGPEIKEDMGEEEMEEALVALAEKVLKGWREYEEEEVEVGEMGEGGEEEVVSEEYKNMADEMWQQALTTLEDPGETGGN